jgi:hypothetical protein
MMSRPMQLLLRLPINTVMIINDHAKYAVDFSMDGPVAQTMGK